MNLKDMSESKLHRFINSHVIYQAGSYLVPEKVVEMMSIYGPGRAKQHTEITHRYEDDLVSIANQIIGKNFKRKKGWIEDVPDERCEQCGKIYRVKYGVCYQDCALKIGDKVWGYLGEYQECCPIKRYHSLR